MRFFLLHYIILGVYVTEQLDESKKMSNLEKTYTTFIKLVNKSKKSFLNTATMTYLV